MSEAMQKAYDAIRGRIVAGEFAPGERLKERDLCAELAVSRTPVREALRRLSSEGLVTIEPRRGAVVADLNADEAAEIYALGAVLESFAARLAAERATPAAVERLRELLAAMEATLARSGSDAQTRYMNLDDEFHDTILAMADNRRLDAVMRQMVRVPVLVQAFHRYRDEDLQQSLHQHRGIVAALAAGDPEWAETAMRAHVLSARAVMIPGER